jgi:hypothetical protein
MELSTTSEATGCAANQEFRRILRNPQVQYRIHKNPPFVLIMSQPHPVHATPFYSSHSGIHLNITHPPMFWSSKWSI